MILCLMLMCQLALMGQTGLGSDPNYNPDSPDDPQTPVKKYELVTVVTPRHGGSTNYSSVSKLAEGEEVYLSAYNRTGYKFVKWVQGDSVVSTTSWFYYTMPAMDVTLEAVFEYNPDNPANPEAVGIRHDLTVVALPKHGGSFNVNNTTIEEGTSTRVYAYPNTGYVFKGWQLGDSVVSTNTSYSFVMGKNDVDLVGLFEYNPDNPSNPGSNAWNAGTGEVVVDDFKQGNLHNAIYNVIGGSNSDDVTMITVAGQMSENDFGFANSYGKCTMIDLKRTYGYSSVPSYAYDYNTSLERVVLPACVETIGYGAFYECSNLMEITCYAVTPPVLERNAFYGIAEGAVVHVLAASIPLYVEADGWRDLTILPLTEEVQALEVNLPAGSEDGRYKNMTLELVNLENGQKQRFVISDRVSYTFNGLLKKSMYNVYVKNGAGVILGQINNIAISDEDVSVTFESLLQPQDVELSVLTKEGEDVTSQVQATWFDASTNTYITRGNTVGSVIEGSSLVLRIALPQTLGMAYVIPADTIYVVKASGNSLSVTLEPLAEVTISGVVKDLTTKGAVQNAVVSVSQTLNGKYSKAITTKTGKDGAYSLTVFDAPGTITYSAADYISQSVNYDGFASVAQLGEVELKSITGATITTNLTFTKSVAEGETPEVQNWYADYANVAYEVYNETQQRQISEFSVQYPKIVLLEEVAEGDVLKLTASSRTNAFVPVTATAVIDAENRAEAMFNILDLGAIRAGFTSTDNSAVVGILYDGKGQLVKKYNYTSATISIENLPEDEYTLVTMGNSSLFNSIFNLSQFAASGLVEGTDYVQNTVSVKSGVVATIVNELIPVLDESKLYYTGNNTLFSVNKTSVTAGNYITLKGKVDFKPEYASMVKNVNMVIDLPETAEFVENSVMVGSSISGYELEENRLIIPLANYYDQVRFCIIPTAGGDYAPSAFVKFGIEDREVLQPIGCVNYAVKDLTISVPSTTANQTVPVSGTALGNSTIQVYDNGVLVGETTSLANGMWSTTCELNDPYNLSVHQIYAKVVNQQGVELLSETKELMYDANAIQVSKVKMYHHNPEVNGWKGKTYEIVYDFLNPSNIKQNYIYYIYNRQFTFTIDFTSNDTTKVSNVVLYVKTGKGRQVPLKATFDAKLQQWVASGEFGNMYDGDLPVNVSVDFDVRTERFVDNREVEDAVADVESLSAEYSEKADMLKLFFADKDSVTSEDIQMLSDKLGMSLETDFSDDDLELPENFDEWDEAVQEAYVDSVYEGMFEENNELVGQISFYDGMFSVESDFEQAFDNGSAIKMTSCTGLDEGKLLADGYETVNFDDGHVAYVSVTDSSTSYVDFSKDVYVVMTFKPEETLLTFNSKTRDFDTARQKYSEVMKVINGTLDIINTKWTDVERMADLPMQKIEEGIEKIQRQLVKVKAWKANSTKSVLKRWKWAEEEARLTHALASAKLAKRLAGSAIQRLLKMVPFASYVATLNDCYNKSQKIYSLYQRTEPCPGDQQDAKACQNSCYFLWGAVGSLATADVLANFISDTQIVGGVIASFATAGTSLTSTIIGGSMKAITIIGKLVADMAIDYAIDDLTYAVNSLECELDDDDDSKGDDNDGGDHDSGNPDSEADIDPSGYVYEGVSSNRVEGVMASVYYKEIVEDMYGDKHENIVLWDAEKHAQENPLFTDENGMYRWDVPQGLWQVKFEKEGYETTYSEWLPVPPPQLEVNIAMKQNSQPEVKSAHAYADGIEVEFSKYMQLDGLTTENIYVTRNGEFANGTVTLLNEEQSYEGKSERYASKVRFVPEIPFLTVDEVVLTVNRKVKSYAGVPMEADFTQEFDIEKEVKSLVADSVVRVPYEGTKRMVISALPYDAAIGKTVVVKSASAMIATVDVDTLTMDENGQAVVVLTGELPGTSVVTYSLLDSDIMGMSTIQVTKSEEKIVATPVASRVSGTAVYRGTEISLSCETENAVIYYTLDGSCPCEESTRFVYEGPIAITDDNVVIKAMAMADDMYDSDVVEFKYSLKKTTLGVSLNDGWNWVSHNVEKPISSSELQKNAIRIVSQTKELVNDSVFGFVGNLDSISPYEAYKVEVSEKVAYVLSGIEYNPANPIELFSGWNWLGYPVNQVLSVNEALANVTPSAGDHIVGQDGFAVYENGSWIGTLTSLKPGTGYMYHANEAFELSYNTAIVSKANALYRNSMAGMAPWAANKNKYPNVMCIIADLYVDGKIAEGYAVGAFCGTECRGVGKYVNGKLMMNVYGEGNETISFLAMNCETEEVYNVSETVVHAETLLGSMRQAYQLHVGESTGILNANVDWSIYVSGADLCLSLNGKPIDRVTLTDVSGNVVLVEDHVFDNGVLSMAGLPDGIYIVTAIQDETMFYHKILKVSR